MKNQTKAKTMPWHRPSCSYCKQPIKKPDDGLAVWFEDRATQENHTPGIVHNGSICGFYSSIERRTQQSLELRDIPIAWFRASPMDAVHIALHWRRSDGDRVRLVWAAWLSVLLGVPFNTQDRLSSMFTEADTVTYLPDHVPRLDEITVDP